MEKPPTKTKPSAEQQHAPDELDARLCQLAQDYLAAFHRNPTEESLQTAQLLLAIGVPDLRRKLHSTHASLLNEARGNFPHAWQRWSWVEVMVPAAVEGHDGDPEAVARTLIRGMPVQLRAECPGYPTNEAELEKAVAAVVAARNFEPELNMWRACGDLDLDLLKVARAVLRGCGMSKDDAKSLTRKSQWGAWVHEHGTT